MRERLNKTQSKILKIYQKASKEKKTPDFDFSRQKISKLFFSRPETSRKSLLEKGTEIKRIHEVESEKEAWTRRTKELREHKVDISDWRERVGLRSGVRHIYTKGQEALRRNLKDLVKKGYLKGAGSGVGSKYRATEKTFKAKLPKI